MNNPLTFYALMRHEKSEEKHSNFNHYTDPNLAWHYWKGIFLQIADKHAPLRLRKVKSEYTPWLTNEIKNTSYHRDFLKKKAVSLQRTTKHIKNAEMK